MTFYGKFTDEQEKEDENDEEEDSEEEFQQKAYMKVELHEIKKDSKYLVSATFFNGSKEAFYQTWNKLQSQFKDEMNQTEAKEGK